ncbi:MAG: hypothetical protein IKH90_05570 [Ruminococcus sp.]|nr:hypothetical protein [Ruminococcus sp.]
MQSKINYKGRQNCSEKLLIGTNTPKGKLVRTNEPEIIGSWNERFEYTDDDIDAYLSYAEKLGCKHIILAWHSLGANKVIYYLSRPLIREPDLINRCQKSDRLHGDSAYYIKLSLLISHNALVNTNKM